MQRRSFTLAAGDRLFDLSLRVLMIAVGATLAGCVTWLTWRWSQPPTVPADVVPLTQVAPKPDPVLAHDSIGSSDARQLLLAPGQVFRCVSGARVTFTDRPCPTGVQ